MFVIDGATDKCILVSCCSVFSNKNEWMAPPTRGQYYLMQTDATHNLLVTIFDISMAPNGIETCLSQ